MEKGLEKRKKRGRAFGPSSSCGPARSPASRACTTAQMLLVPACPSGPQAHTSTQASLAPPPQPTKPFPARGHAADADNWAPAVIPNSGSLCFSPKAGPRHQQSPRGPPLHPTIRDVAILKQRLDGRHLSYPACPILHWCHDAGDVAMGFPCHPLIPQTTLTTAPRIGGC